MSDDFVYSLQVATSANRMKEQSQEAIGVTVATGFLYMPVGDGGAQTGAQEMLHASQPQQVVERKIDGRIGPPRGERVPD